MASKSPARRSAAEVEGFLVLIEFDLAHGWRDKGFATLFADKCGHFAGTAAFEGEDAGAVEGHGQL